MVDAIFQRIAPDCTTVTLVGVQALYLADNGLLGSLCPREQALHQGHFVLSTQVSWWVYVPHDQNSECRFDPLFGQSGSKYATLWPNFHMSAVDLQALWGVYFLPE